MRRLLCSLVFVLIASTALTGCHGGLHAQPVITGLEFPAAFTIGPDNDTIWYGERFSGEIRRRDLSSGQDTLVWTVPNVVTGGEQGLLGLALHPDYPSSPFLYAFASRMVLDAPRNQILRITLSGGVGVSQTPVMGDLGIMAFHNGGRIVFGPDDNLYAVIGDHQSPANSQTLDGNNNKAGKILRLTPDGGVPTGNPFPGSLVWAFGIRNSFGLAFDPASSRLWLTDNGPTCNDEVNRIVAGGNYAWGPNATCATPPAAPDNTNQDGPTPRRLPALHYPDSRGITGLAFCSGCGLGSQFEGRVLHGFVTDGVIHRLTLDGTRTAVTADDIVYDHPRGVLSVETRPGQPVYFSDSEAIYKLTL